MARPPITARGDKLFRVQLDDVLDYLESISGGAGSIDSLSDVAVTAPSVGQVLKWNGTAWVNDTDATGGGGGATGGAATVSFGAAPGSSTAETVITGQASILSGSRIHAWVQGTTADYNEYEHSLILPQLLSFGVSDVVAGTGFTIQATTKERLTGDVAVKWEWA